MLTARKLCADFVKMAKQDWHLENQLETFSLQTYIKNKVILSWWWHELGLEWTEHHHHYSVLMSAGDFVTSSLALGLSFKRILSVGTWFCCLISSMVSLRETSSLCRLTHAWLKYKYRVSKWQTLERKVSRFVTVTGTERCSWCTNLQFSTASASGRIFLILICHLSNSTKTSQQFVKINQRIKSKSTRGSKTNRQTDDNIYN